MIQLGEHKEKQKAILCSHNGSVSQKTLGIEVNGFSHGLLLSVCLFVVSHFHKDQVSHVMLGQHCHKHYPHTGDSASSPLHG